MMRNLKLMALLGLLCLLITTCSTEETSQEPTARPSNSVPQVPPTAPAGPTLAPTPDPYTKITTFPRDDTADGSSFITTLPDGRLVIADESRDRTVITTMETRGHELERSE